MSLLRFRRGVNKWDRDYEVAIRYGYTADLEKKIASISLYINDIGRSVEVPWRVFKGYLYGETHPYVDASGFSIHPTDQGLRLRDSDNLNMIIHKDQMRAIQMTAEKVKNDIRPSIKNLKQRLGVKGPSRFSL